VQRKRGVERNHSMEWGEEGGWRPEEKKLRTKEAVGRVVFGIGTAGTGGGNRRR